MAKDGIKKSIYALKREIDEVINNYKEIPYGCGYNIGAESKKESSTRKSQKGIGRKKHTPIRRVFLISKSWMIKKS